jgi:hypothetical protein
MSSPINNAWHVASRRQEFSGEIHAALLRSCLVVIFYSVQLIHYLSLPSPGAAERYFHRSATYVSAAWLMISLTTFIALRSGFLPAFLKYVTTSLDLSLVTLLSWLGTGTRSPLIAVFFLVVALAVLRFRVGLVWFATVGSMIGYMFLVATGDKKWFDTEHETPIIVQAVTLCSLASVGVVLDQAIRSLRTTANVFASKLGLPQEKKS